MEKGLRRNDNVATTIATSCLLVTLVTTPKKMKKSFGKKKYMELGKREREPHDDEENKHETSRCNRQVEIIPCTGTR